MKLATISRLLIIASLTCAGMTQQVILGQELSPIPEVGRMVDIPGAHETPNPSLVYKIVFDLKSTGDKADEVNSGTPDGCSAC